MLVKILHSFFSVILTLIFKLIYIKSLNINIIKSRLNGNIVIGSARVSVGDYFRARSGLNFNVTSGVLSIGDNVFFNRNCSINVRKNVSIGNDCMFGENVLIYDHDHNFKKLDIPFSKQGFFCDEVKIGNNVWIGSNTIILKGVSIGNNVVVGAGSVVSKNIESDCIYRQDIIRNIKFINRD